MVDEYPRPLYTGDLIRCDYYSRYDGLDTDFQFTLDADIDLQLELDQPGLRNDSLYEVIFGPFQYVLSDPETDFLTFSLAYGSLFSLSLSIYNKDFDRVPVVGAFFAPTVQYQRQAFDLNEPFLATFSVSGSGTASISFGGTTNDSSVFGYRLVDTTTPPNFTVINLPEQLDFYSS